MKKENNGIYLLIAAILIIGVLLIFILDYFCSLL